ncbi:MAG: hypothetical protein ACHRXM_13520 [Isosphaerales bacterium]
MSRKPRKCRICRKRPVWRGGDVKNPGPVCKQCYHKKVWPDLMAGQKKRQAQRENGTPIEQPIPDHLMMDPNYYYWHFVRDDDD